MEELMAEVDWDGVRDNLIVFLIYPAIENSE
jgi:hypothetical protein